MSATDTIYRISRRQKVATCKIERATRANDNSASPVATWASHIPTLHVVMQLTSGSESVRYGRDSNRYTGRAFVQPGLDINAGTDRLVWNSRTFEITSVRTPGEMQNGDRMAFMVLDIEETQENAS